MCVRVLSAESRDTALEVYRGMVQYIDTLRRSFYFLVGCLAGFGGELAPPPSNKVHTSPEFYGPGDRFCGLVYYDCISGILMGRREVTGIPW